MDGADIEDGTINNGLLLAVSPPVAACRCRVGTQERSVTPEKIGVPQTG